MTLQQSWMQRAQGLAQQSATTVALYGSTNMPAGHQSVTVVRTTAARHVNAHQPAANTTSALAYASEVGAIPQAQTTLHADDQAFQLTFLT